MEDLARLLTLIKFCSDNHESFGIETLFDIAVEKAPFDAAQHDTESAYDGAIHMLHTLFDIEFKDQFVYGKPKLSLEGLFGDLVLLLERMATFEEANQAQQWPDA